MTEQEWNDCGEIRRMFAALRGIASDRKMRLFMCACCRRLWQWLGADGRNAIEVAEAFADGLASGEQLRSSRLSKKYGWWMVAGDQASRNAVKAGALERGTRQWAAYIGRLRV